MREFRYCPFCASTLTLRSVAGRERRACECSFVHYGNPLPVVAAIVETPEGVVLARQPDWPPRTFGLPTGFLEAGETPEEAVAREVREEIGLVVDEVATVGVFAFLPKNEVLLAYAMRGHGALCLGAELAEVKVVPVANLRGWDFGTGLAVKAWLEDRR